MCLLISCFFEGLIARTANNDICSILESHDVSPNDRAYLHRIQRYMLALVPRFVLTEGVVKELSSGSSDGKVETQRTPDRLIYSMQVASNLALYTRNLTANHGVEHGSAQVIFQATLTDPLASNMGGKYQFSHYSEQNPSIGVIIQQLVNCVHYYHSEKVSLDILKRRVSNVPTMNTVDLKEFVPAPTRTFNIFIIREQALEILTERLKYKQKEMEYCTFLIESCLYLIWSHLDYYMLKAIPKTKNYGFGISNETGK